MNKQMLKGYSEMLILAALARRSMHGYALSEYLKDEMGQLFKFGVGMLYPILHQMEKDKLIVGQWEVVAGADRRVYRLTKAGQKSLQAKRSEWQTMTQLVKKLVHNVV